MVQLGGHELLEEIGRGGMGRVHRARHLATGGLRAVKILGDAPDAERVTRFQREAEALARVEAGVVGVHQVGCDGGRHFLVMELMPGGSLRDRLKARGRFPWREATELVLELARIVERCHRLGLVHRDLKPGNVLFDAQGRPRLADFGCVRDATAPPLTATGIVLGTPAYMSPEQKAGESGPDVDLWALGAVLYELVTGVCPGYGAPAAVPPPLRSLLARVLGTRARRYPDAGTLIAALEEVLRGADSLRQRARRVMALGFVFGGAAALGIALVLFGELGSPSETASHAATGSHTAAPRSPPVPPTLALEPADLAQVWSLSLGVERGRAAEVSREALARAESIARRGLLRAERGDQVREFERAGLHHLLGWLLDRSARASDPLRQLAELLHADSSEYCTSLVIGQEREPTLEILLLLAILSEKQETQLGPALVLACKEVCFRSDREGSVSIATALINREAAGWGPMAVEARWARSDLVWVRGGGRDDLERLNLAADLRAYIDQGSDGRKRLQARIRLAELLEWERRWDEGLRMLEVGDWAGAEGSRLLDSALCRARLHLWREDPAGAIEALESGVARLERGPGELLLSLAANLQTVPEWSDEARRSRVQLLRSWRVDRGGPFLAGER